MTATNPELTAAVERAAYTCHNHMHNMGQPSHVNIADFKLRILRELSPVVERLEQAAVDSFIDSLITRLESRGIDATNWDGDDDPAEIVAGGIAGAVGEAETLCDSLAGALKDLFAMMDEGLLVRDTRNDADSGWAIKQLRFVSRLSAAHSSLAAFSKFKEGK